MDYTDAIVEKQWWGPDPYENPLRPGAPRPLLLTGAHDQCCIGMLPQCGGWLSTLAARDTTKAGRATPLETIIELVGCVQDEDAKLIMCVPLHPLACACLHCLPPVVRPSHLFAAGTPQQNT